MTLELRGRRQIDLVDLRQRLIYEEIIHGHPHPGLNDQLIQSWLEHAQSVFPKKVHLIPPRRGDPLPRWRTATPVPQEKHPDVPRWKIPEYLPEVVSLGFFRSQAMGEHPEYRVSALTILWFQHDFGVSPDVTSVITEIDWESLAVDILDE